MMTTILQEANYRSLCMSLWIVLLQVVSPRDSVAMISIVGGVVVDSVYVVVLL